MAGTGRQSTTRTRAFGTIRGTYESQLHHIPVRFEHAEIGGITSSDVRRWHSNLLKSGLSPNTVAKVYRQFRTIVTTAVEDGLIRADPVKDHRLVEVGDVQGELDARQHDAPSH